MPERWCNPEDDGASASPTARLRFGRGDAVERVIDAEWFRGRVTDCYVEDAIAYYEVLYDDDGKSEPEIPEDELRACAPGTPPGAPARETASAKLDSPKSPLERSLCDDSWEAPEPVAFTHKVSHGSGGAFVVNGNETKLGAGGGLRGIRFLRESVNMQ